MKYFIGKNVKKTQTDDDNFLIMAAKKKEEA